MAACLISSENALLASRGHLLSTPSVVGTESGRASDLASPLTRALTPSRGLAFTVSSKPKPLANPHLQIPSHLGLSLQHRTFEGTRLNPQHPLCGFNTSSLLIHVLVDAWVVSTPVNINATNLGVRRSLWIPDFNSIQFFFTQR